MKKTVTFSILLLTTLIISGCVQTLSQTAPTTPMPSGQTEVMTTQLTSNGTALLQTYANSTLQIISKTETLPVHILAKDNYATASDTVPNGSNYPQSVVVGNSGVFADQIAAYGGAEKVWIGPKGWDGQAETGADGGARTDLFPSGGSTNSGPHITYSEEPGCVGCMISEASFYFPKARQEYQKDFDPTPIKIPKGLKVTSISPTLVTYTLPDSNGLSTRGVAFYKDSMTDPYYIEATFVFPKAQLGLSKFLQQAFIDRENLK